MAWKSWTSFLGSHWTYTQQNTDSCGPCSVMMMIRKRTNMAVSEQDAFLAYDSYGNPTEYSNPAGLTIKEYHGTIYTSADRLARTIRTLIGNAKSFDASTNHVGQLIRASLRKGEPLIGLVSWRGGGGHFVMLDAGGSWNGVYYAAACDPWDGAVRLVAIGDTGPVNYRPDYPETIKNQGAQGANVGNGYFNGWVVR